jgi:hypothetical protein
MSAVLTAPAAVDFGVSIRNPNFLKLGITWLVVGCAAVAINVVSSFRLEEVGVLLAGGPLLLGAFELMKWRRTYLVVESSGITSHRIAQTLACTWDEIDGLDLLGPGDRTPFVLNFAWWADRASLRLVTGTRHPVPAIQPYHGFTSLTFLKLRQWTTADELVEQLNQMVRGARGVHRTTTFTRP